MCAVLPRQVRFIQPACDSLSEVTQAIIYSLHALVGNKYFLKMLCPIVDRGMLYFEALRSDALEVRGKRQDQSSQWHHSSDACPLPTLDRYPEDESLPLHTQDPTHQNSVIDNIVRVDRSLAWRGHPGRENGHQGSAPARAHAEVQPK